LKKITSTDIAKIAGVSRSTVSRVINNYDNVPDETRKKILDIIAEHEYYPDLPAQLLAGKSTKTIGFFFIKKFEIHDDFLSSSFMVNVIEAAAELGYLVLTCMISDIKDEEQKNWVKSIFMQGRIDAGIFIGVNNHELLIENLISLGKIVAVFDHMATHEHEYNRISANFERNTGDKVIDYLFSKGHRKIAVIDGDMNTLSGMDRHISIIGSMQKHNIMINPKWMLRGVYEDGSYYDGAYLAVKKLVETSKNDMPTVICAGNDEGAFGVYNALTELGYSIPEDISVIGMDGNAKGEYVDPPLTTFATDFHQMFVSLVKRTVQTIHKEDNVERIEWSESNLVERSSCKEVKV
jgi:LacI family transcriptional regulator